MMKHLLVKKPVSFCLCGRNGDIAFGYNRCRDQLLDPIQFVKHLVGRLETVVSVDGHRFQQKITQQPRYLGTDICRMRERIRIALPNRERSPGRILRNVIC